MFLFFFFVYTPCSLLHLIFIWVGFFLGGGEGITGSRSGSLIVINEYLRLHNTIDLNVQDTR